MIQVYAKGNTDFEKNGDMTLLPESARIHIVLCGTWEATLFHPIDEEGRWEYLTEEAVIKMPSFNGDQLFRIGGVEKGDDGVTCSLTPIFFDSRDDVFLQDVRPEKKSGQEALDILCTGKYSGESDILYKTTAYYEYKNLLEALVGDDENSFINRWGGEPIFDNYRVIINARAGADHNVEIRYGKNMPENGMSIAVDMTNVATRIYPKAYNGHKMSGQGYVDSPLINNYEIVHSRTITFEDVKMREDASEDDEEAGVIVCDTQAELDAALTNKCNAEFANEIDKPTVTIYADLILLQNTEEYSDIADLETVSLGDTVHCYNKKFGFFTNARVVELTYNAMTKRVENVTLGAYKTSFVDDMMKSIGGIEAMAESISKAFNGDGTIMAEKVKGILNGAMASLRAQYDIAQKQDVIAILFENLDPTSDLYGALAIGTQGWMISKVRNASDTDWVWTTAATASGIVADTIVTGILSDKAGNNYWNLDTGEFRLSWSATVGDKTMDQAVSEKSKAATREILDIAGAYGLGWKINADVFGGSNNGECYYYGYAADGSASDKNGWVQWNGSKVTIPKGCHINPGSTMPFDTDIYSVYRTSDQSFHDVCWNKTTKAWEGNTYTGSEPSERTAWTWNDATDIVLASYRIPSSEGAIYSALLFTPPKKHMDLAESAYEYIAEETVSYRLMVSHAVVVKEVDGTYDPATITVSAEAQKLGEEMTAYAGRFKIEKRQSGTWTTVYTSSADETDKVYTIASETEQIRVSLYRSGGTTSLLDTQIVPIVSEGYAGEDGYTVLLTNESHTFAGSETAALAGMATSKVITYKGSTQVACYAGASASATSISTGVTGLTCTISNNNSKNVMLTFTATTELTANSGTVAIPVVVDGKAFELTFSFSVALKGAAGADGEDAYYLETPFTWNTGETQATFTAVIYKGETDVTENYHSSCFEWYLRTENGESRIAVGRTCTVAKSALGYGGTVVCIFTSHENENAALLTRSNKALLSASGSRLTMLTQSEGEIRVVDLPVKTATAVNLDDYLMGIDAADGYQVTVSDLATRMATGVFDARYVNADGDTMTGNLTLPKANLNWSIDTSLDEARSGSQFGSGIYAYDGKNRNIFYNEMALVSDRIYRSYVVRGFDSSGAEVGRNGFYLDVMNDGTIAVRFANDATREAWVNALNVVKRTGGSLTGNCDIKVSSGDARWQVTNTYNSVTRTAGILSNNSGSGVYIWSPSAVAGWLCHTDGSKKYFAGMDFTNAASARSSIGAVNNAGDTMTGSLNAKFSTFDLSKSNNGVSSTQYPTTFCIEDSAGRIATRVEGVVSSNGSMAAFWYVRNYNTSGTMVAQKGIQMTMNKSGTLTYSVSDPANFRSAIGCAPSGYLKGWTSLGSTTGTTAKAITASSYTEILVVMNRGTSYWGSCLIPVVALSTTANEWYCGGGNKGSSSPSGRRGVFKATTTAITPVLVTVDGTDYSDSAVVTRVYAR